MFNFSVVPTICHTHAIFALEPVGVADARIQPKSNYLNSVIFFL
jgi:hypothetical protein